MNARTKVANAIVDEILFKGLADSTWRDNFPEAYDHLLTFYPDMVGSAIKILDKKTTC